MQLLLTDYINKAMSINAVQLFFSAGCPVSYKDNNGNLVPLPFGDEPFALKPEHTKALVEQAVKERHDRETLRDYGETETALSSYGRMRSRVNAYIQRGTYAMTITILTSNAEAIIPAGQWGLDFSPILGKPSGGICIITGHHDTVKLAASLTDYFNANYKCHIVTLEDGVTTLHRHKMAVVNQRDLSKNIDVCREALRRVKNLGADVCMVSSSKSEELFADMLELAMSGVFVIGVFGKSSPIALGKSLSASINGHDREELSQKLRKCLRLCVDLDNDSVITPDSMTEWLTKHYDS